MKFTTVLISLFLLLSSLTTDNGRALKPAWHKRLKIAEPSDMAFNGMDYFVVSDNGDLYKTNDSGRVVLKAKQGGTDFEAAYADADRVYVSDESTRRVFVYEAQTLELKRIIPYTYAAGRNDGFESLTYNPVTKKFIMVSERNSTIIWECDENFQVLNQVDFKAARDISAATFHEGKLWLLSDENHQVFRLNPENYAVEKTYTVNVINPEGICFDKNGRLLILSDDMQMLYCYNLPDNP